MLLDMRVERLIVERFRQLNALQKKSMKAVLSGKDVLIVAPVGFGKTEAVMIPIFHKLLEYKDKEKENTGINALYITPLRSLNRDMMSRLEWWANRLGISIDVRHGDTPQSRRIKQSRKPPQLLITTPETFTGMLSAKRLGAALSHCRHIVVDEIHSLINNKRGMQLALSLERLDEKLCESNFTKGAAQRIGLSATIGDKETALRYLSPANRCVLVDLGIRKKMKITVEYPTSYKDERFKGSGLDKESLGRLMRVKELVSDEKTLVFVNTRQVAEALGSRLLMLKAKIGVHHGSLAKPVRIKTENDFRKNRINALIATSSLELGIDIGDINRVVQYMSPRQVSRLVQRVGRSGHTMERVPVGVLIVSDIEDALESIAIVDLLYSGWQEKLKVEKDAYDVIAHQTVGLLLERDRIKLDDVHRIFSRSDVYNISMGELVEIAEQMSSQGILYYDKRNNELRKSLASRLYYYTHLSTIPKTKKFRVKDIERGRFISSLDAGFVATLSLGDTFITRGLPWKVIDITSDEVLVEASVDFSLSLPDWEGEEIPVPFEVAQRAASYKPLLSRKGMLPQWLFNAVGAHKELHNELSSGASARGFVPDDKTVVIESFADLIVIHSPFGSLVNATLGRVIARSLLGGSSDSIRILCDPYRIIIQSISHVNPELVDRFLKTLKEEDVFPILVSSLEGTRLFSYKFNHVAQNFGMIKEGETVSKRIIRFMKHLPVYKETMRVLMKDYFDVDRTKRVIAMIKKGLILTHVVDAKELSTWAGFGLSRARAGELLSHVEPRSEIVKAFAEHVLKMTVKLQCTYCKKSFYTRIEDTGRKLQCSFCRSAMVGYAGFFKDGRLIEKDKNAVETSVPLVQAYGRRALIALSIYGVGVETARKILQRLHKEESLLFFDLLEAQKRFIRTRRYWRL